jgi:arylsulfatase A-like enzyme
MKVYNCMRLLLMCAMVLTLNDSVAQTKPNIVFILTDDQGWGDLSIHGNTNVRTPNIDKLARDGARFARFYVAPLCAPTRAGLLTGRYHYRGGVYGVSNSKEYLNTDEVTFADLFKKAGYATGCFGKWHNGSQYPYHPNGRGFDEFYGFLSGHYANYFNTMLDHNGEAVRSTGFITDDLTEKAIGFIEKNKEKPFVCYIPYNAPHSPFQVPDEYYDRVKKRGITKLSQHPDEEDLETTISALAMCENIDWNVGRILKKLDDLKLSKNTIVIYMTDNGPSTWRWNGDMKGKKAMAEEGGVRVPFFIRWPGTIPAGKVIQDNAAYIDILPTLAELAGISKAGTKPLDGVSLKPVIVGTSTLPDRLLFTSINKKNSVRKWPYLLSESGLYDLSKDSTQQTNLANTQPEVFKTLSGALDQWYNEVTENADTVRWLPIGFAQFPKATLPSQDAHLHRSKGSSLSYSASAPNSSWITNWTDTTSFVTWDIDVHTTGTYQVNVLYTCAESEIGSKFSIHFGSKSLQGSFDEAFNPPLISSPDRVKRKGESYEKEFKRKQLARWTLEKGKGQIRLNVNELKGARFADIKAIELELWR